MKEPSKNHDIWVQVLFGSFRGLILYGGFGSVRVLHVLYFRLRVRFGF